MDLKTENKILKEALGRFASLISGEAMKADITQYKVKGSDIYVAQQALALTKHPSCVDGVMKHIGDLIDSSLPEGSGQSIVPTKLVEDLREAVFSVPGR